jgi:hypothetical protein
MTSLTVTGNTAVSDAGGVYISNSNGQVSVDNNIFDGNSVTQNGFNGPIDFYVSNVNQQSFNDIGYNLVGISDNMFTQDSNDILNNTTGLANALALNGAPAGNPLTLALSKNNSPGYDTGDQSLASQANPNSIDERGLTRQAKGVAGQEVSIGAYDPDAK